MPHSIADMTRTYGTGHLTIRTDSKGQRSWYGQWRAEGRKVKRKIGPVRERGSKTGLSRMAAERELRRKIDETTVEPKGGRGMTFQRAGEIYLKHLRRAGRQKATLTAVESCLRVWVVPHFKAVPMHRVTFRQVELLVAKMERKLSAKSIHNYVGTLSALFTYGMDPRRGWATSNPCQVIELPAIPEPDDIRFLTVEQVEALIRALPDDPYGWVDAVLYRTAAMTGLREGELCALRWGAIDWTARKVRVRQNWVLGETKKPKSRRGTRAVPLALDLAKVLAAFQPVEAEDDDLVFPDPLTGGELDKAAIMRRYRKALKAAGLDGHHVFHDLRHTFGTRMAAAGVPMRTLQEWMGHRDLQTTLRYADYAPSAHEAEMVDAAFGGAAVNEDAEVGA